MQGNCLRLTLRCAETARPFGPGADIIALLKTCWTLLVWNNAGFEKRPFAFTNGVDATCNVVAAVGRCAARMAVPMAGGVVPPFWASELTMMDEAVRGRISETR